MDTGYISCPTCEHRITLDTGELLRVHAADLTAQLATMTAERNNLIHKHARLEAERDRLREAIEARPHEDCGGSRSCGICLMPPGSIVHDMGHPRADIHHRFVRGNCTCWKREALEGERR